MIKLALALLDPAQRASSRVPVIFDLTAWDGEQDFDAWLVGQLVADPVFEEVIKGDRKLAEEMISGRFVDPFLDNLDGIRLGDRIAVIHYLNSTRNYGDPVVIASRPEEYAEAIEWLNGYLKFAPAVRLLELTPDEVVRYLSIATPQFESGQEQGAAETIGHPCWRV